MSINLRVQQLLAEHKLHDNSFQEKETILSILFGEHKYTQSEVREIWFKGIECGIRIGLNNASLEGQIIELSNNVEDSKHIEFLEKLYKLTNEYNCAIQYHPQFGMVVIDKTIKGV